MTTNRRGLSELEFETALAKADFQRDKNYCEKVGVTEQQYVSSRLISAGLAELEIGATAGETPAEADPAAWMTSDLEGTPEVDYAAMTTRRTL